MPDEDAIREATEKTRAALEQRLSGQIQSIRTTHVDKPDRDATYIRYTPGNATADTNSGAGQRIIRMVNQQVCVPKSLLFLFTVAPSLQNG